MRKNVANQVIGAHLVDAAGADVTTGITTVYFTGDNGTRASIGTATHKGGGDWTIDTGLAANSNFNHILAGWENPNAVNLAQNIYPTSLNPDASYALESTSQDLSSRIPPALIDDRIDANMSYLIGVEQYALNLGGGASQVINFLVGASASSTSIPTDITISPYTNPNHFKDRVVSIDGETKKILASGGSPVVLTTSAFVSVPPQNRLGVIS